MGAFVVDIREGRRHERVTARNVLSWRCHDRIFPKITAFDDVSTAFRIGFMGPSYRSEKTDAPNADEGYFALDRRIGIGDLFNEAGLPDADMRDMEGYERQAVEWTVTRDGHGAIIDTGWHAFVSRIGWAPHPEPAPQDWEIEHADGELYHAPWSYGDCRPWHTLQDFPFCTPNIWEGWWQDLADHCIDPVGNAGSCPAWEAESGYPSCGECYEHGLMALSAYPVGLAFVTIRRSDGEEEVFAAARFNGPAWWRRSGTIRVRYRGRFGP